MKFTGSILLAAAPVALGLGPQGYNIPTNLPDGLYGVILDNQGNPQGGPQLVNSNNNQQVNTNNNNQNNNVNSPSQPNQNGGWQGWPWSPNGAWPWQQNAPPPNWQQNAPPPSWQQNTPPSNWQQNTPPSNQQPNNAPPRQWGPFAGRPGLTRRDSFPGSVELGCSGRDLDGAGEMAAWNDMAGWCGDGSRTSQYSVYFAKRQGTIWYSCSKIGPQPCNKKEMTDARERFEHGCSHLKSGRIYVQDWKKTYGRAAPGDNICGNGF